MTATLPPFPVDDQTLDLLLAALDPWGHGYETAERSSLGEFLELLSQMAGSDTGAVAEQIDDHAAIMRDPQYSHQDMITALIDEVRRLRAQLQAREAGQST